MALHHRLLAKAARLYWWARRPRTLGVRAVVRDDAGRIALVRHTYAPGWYLPGGGVKKGESVAGALARELAEEIGLRDCAIERLIGVYHSRREYKDDHVVLFAVRAADPGAVRACDKREIACAAWFSPDALPADTSPATARRIEDYRTGATGSGNW
jgi:ADP-ribose pyrophosphatase YjhB (NUDIX family)